MPTVAGRRWVYVVSMDNDGIHKLTHRLRPVFADLLRLVAPELVPSLDLLAATELSSAHVAARDGALEHRFGDLTWRVPFKRGPGHVPGQVLAVPLEFQSTVHRAMANRMRRYGEMLQERLAAPVGGRRREVAPWLLPIVVYNGSDRWTASGAAVQTPAPSAQARLLAPYQPAEYVLLSLERLLAEGGGSLSALPLGNRVAATLRLQAERTALGLVKRLRTEWHRFPEADDQATRRALHAWTAALLAEHAGDRAAALLPTVAQLEGETEMTTVSEARLGKWFKDEVAKHTARGHELGLAEGRAKGMAQGVAQGRAEGVAQGVAQGRAEGVAQGRAEGVAQERARSLALLRRQAAGRFGAATAERLQALVGSDASAAQLERLGEWIIDCGSGPELLARISGHGDDAS